MADDLLAALQGLQVSPLENPYGQGFAGLAVASPQLINPYGSVGSNLAIGLGSALAQGFLANQAQSQAAEETLRARKLALELEGMSPADRIGFVEKIDTPRIQNRLLGLEAALTARESAIEQTQRAAEAQMRGQTLGPLQAAVEIEKDPNLSAAFKADLERRRKQADAESQMAASLRAKQDIELSPRGKELRDEETQAAILSRLGVPEDATKRQEIIEFNRQLSGAKRKSPEQIKQELIDKTNEAVRENKLKIEQKLDLERQMNELEMKNIREGQDPELARDNAKNEVERRLKLTLQQNEFDNKKELIQLKGEQLAKKELNLSPQQQKDINASLQFVGLLDDITPVIKNLTYPQKLMIDNLGTAFDLDPEVRSQLEFAKQLYRQEQFGKTLTGTEKESARRVFAEGSQFSVADMVAAFKVMRKEMVARGENIIQTATKTPTQLLNVFQQAKDKPLRDVMNLSDAAAIPSQQSATTTTQKRPSLAEMKQMLNQLEGK